MSSAGGEKRASTGEGGGEKKKKKKNYKWLLEGVWSEHELDGKTYYYNHVRACGRQSPSLTQQCLD